MRLEFKKDYRGFGGDVYKIGEIIDYHPWNYEWQGMTEPERVKKGVFVHCYGMGEFDVFRDTEVKMIK